MVQAVQKFGAFADDKLPKLKNKLYSDYRLATDEWNILELVKEVLAVRHGYYLFVL